jgi:drug/metabolite transporter (DMT)-like permease
MGSKNRQQMISRNWGPLLVLLSQIMSGLMNLCVKTLETKASHPISPFHILNIRMIITLVLSVIYCWVKDIKDFPAGPREVRWLMVVRSVGGCCSAIGFYFSLEYLPLAEASAFSLLAPLGCCIASALLMSGAMSKVQIGAAVTSTVAIFITAQPTFIAKHLGLVDNNPIEYANAYTKNMSKGIAFALFGAFGGAVSCFILHDLLIRTLHTGLTCSRFNEVCLHLYSTHREPCTPAHERKLLRSYNHSCGEHHDTFETRLE